MPSNAFGTLNHSLSAQRCLDLLVSDFPFISAITTDFSDPNVGWSGVVNTRILSPIAATDFSDTNGYVATGISNTNVQVTINKFKSAVIEISDKEFSAAVNRDLTEEFAIQAKDSLGLAIMADLAALAVTTGTFTNNAVVPLTGISRATAIVAPKTALSVRKVKNPTFAIFNADAYGQLWSDPTMISVDTKGVGISATTLPTAHGITPYEYQDLPTTANTLGLVGRKDALVFAATVPKLPERADAVIVQNQDGLAVAVHTEYANGITKFVYSIMYGVAAGNTAALQRIKSA